MNTYDMIINGGVQPGKSQIRTLRETLGLPSGGNTSENATPGGLSPSQGAVRNPQTPPVAAPAQPVQNQPATTQAGSQGTLPAVNNPGLTAPAVVQNPQTLPGAQEKPKPLTYEDMYRRLNPFKPLSEEELEAQRRRQRSNQVVTALGDGISAIANLVATSHGAHDAYDGRTTLTGSQLARYDQLRKDYDDNLRAYMSGLVEARRMDEAKANADWQKEFQISRAKADDENRKTERKHRQDREAVQDEQWEKTFNHKQEQDKEANDERTRHNQVVESQGWTKIANDKDYRDKVVDYKSRGGSKNVTTFDDTDGHRVNIPNSVWQGSAQVVFDELKRLVKDSGVRVNESLLKTETQKRDFVKQYWHKFDKTRAMMYRLAQQSYEPEEDIDLEQFAEGDDEFSQYLQ